MALKLGPFINSRTQLCPIRVIHPKEKHGQNKGSLGR